MFLRLAFKSLLNRKGSVSLTLLAMTVSIFVLLGVEHVRQQAKESFRNTVSGLDLVVGAKTSGLNLLLYSVFRIGSPTNNISWRSFEEIGGNPHIAWAVPISLGDSHRGYRVLGTSRDYFQHYGYGRKRKLTFSQGQPFAGVFEVVLGSEVARKLDYHLGENLILTHGLSNTNFNLHKDKSFQVVGILGPTGTPVDQTLHVSLAGIEAVHSDWTTIGERSFDRDMDGQLIESNLKPEMITAFMVGLKSKMTTFRVQRDINNYTSEPLLAILPGVALSELWQMTGMLENVLRLASVLILASSLLGLSAMLLASIRERKHEIQLLRAIGASPRFIFLLIELEALLISFFSIVIGATTLYFFTYYGADYLASSFGLYIDTAILSRSNSRLCLIVLIATALVATLPSFNAYRKARSGL